jgi:uncharacterized membrane protein (UPF0136 family)
MQIAAIVMMVYGAFILVGGVMGAAASLISLVTGVIFGGLAIASGWGLRGQQNWGFYLGAAVSLFLTLFFGSRFVQTGAIFPALVTLIFSLVAFIVLMYVRGRKAGRVIG